MCKYQKGACQTAGWYIITLVINVDDLLQLPQNRHRFGKQTLHFKHHWIYLQKTNVSLPQMST